MRTRSGGGRCASSAESTWLCGTWPGESSISRYRSFWEETSATKSCSIPTRRAGDYLSKEEWRDRAQRLLSDPRGFKAYKVDIHHALGINMQEFTPSIGPEEARKINRAYTLAREAFGPDIGIDVHCHCELDVSSAIKVARAVEPIDPLFFEDPLAPEWSDGWMALRRATHLPIMTGENMELGEWAIPFLNNQAVDIFQPDIINSGGITGVKMIADLAALYRVPIALHNVSGLLLNLASQQVAAAVFDCPRIECATGADKFRWATRNPIVIKNGKMQVTTDPGLGMELDQEYLKANRADGEPWWD